MGFLPEKECDMTTENEQNKEGISNAERAEIPHDRLVGNTVLRREHPYRTSLSKLMIDVPESDAMELALHKATLMMFRDVAAYAHKYGPCTAQESRISKDDEAGKIVVEVKMISLSNVEL